LPQHNHDRIAHVLKEHESKKRNRKQNARGLYQAAQNKSKHGLST
jgi:hypothetical protein